MEPTGALPAGIVGFVCCGVLSGVFWLLKYLFKKKDEKNDDTLDKILLRLDTDKEKEVRFSERWGALTKELEIISSNSTVVQKAATEIIVLRRDINSAFAKFDDLKSLVRELEYAVKSLSGAAAAIEHLERSQRDEFRTVNRRLFVLKRALEGVGGKISNQDWVDENPLPGG